MNAPLSPADAVKALRNRYPGALVCSTCAALLATSRESYEKSGLSEEQRLAYVCSECRREAAEAASTAASRTEAARQNLIKANAAKAARKALQATDGYLVESAGNQPSRTRTNSGDEGVVSMTVDRKRGTTTCRGGRPVKHVSESERKQAAREASRQYLANRRTQQTQQPVAA